MFIVTYEFVGNKAKGRISKRVFQENRALQIFRKTNISSPPITHESAKSRGLRVYVLACLVCLRAYVFGVLCLHACYDACLACLALAYSRFCLIIYFVCMNQGFAIKRKVASLNVQSP